MTKLPNVFVKKNYKLKDNNKEFFYGNDKLDKNKEEVDSLIIKKKINDIFSSPSFVYKMKVLITFKDKEEIVTIISKTNNILLTMEGKEIKISDILNIKPI